MTDFIARVRLESNDFECDNVQVSELEGVERISHPFRFDVDIVCLDPAGLDSKSVVGSIVTLVFTHGDEVVRRVHGMIESIEDRLETEANYRSYRLLIVPRLRRLALVETLDVFLGQSVPEIIEHKLDLVGLVDAFDNRLLETYPKRDFVVQYRETDLDCISRLLEHIGISYIFQHDDTQDRIMLVDAADSFPQLAQDVLYRGRGEKTDVFAIRSRTQLIPEIYMVRDYNYRTPSLDLEATRKSDIGYAGGVVEFGNHTKNVDEATRMATVRSQEREAQQLIYDGESGVMALTAGARFHLSEHPHVTEGLLLVEVRHHLVQPLMMSGGGSERKPAVYNNTFAAIPSERTYRPQRITPRPRISGVVTGVIEEPTGSSKRFPLIDDQGRYTVRFIFDTAAPGEKRASHPVRLAQLSVGTRYGTHFPLRPGTEVIVVFTDGDPDRPIIAGAIPNPEVSSPVVGDEAMKSRIKSESGVLIEFSDR